MIAKLPRWVWIGTWVLAFIAGIINVVGLLGFDHQTVTHLTGNTSRLAADVANLNWSGASHVLAIILSFVAGTVISGIVIQNSTLQLGRRYSVVLMLESILLFLSVPLFRQQNELGLYAAACASGLQNAMVSAYSDTSVRTTHLSGMFTDLGLYLGHAIRGIPINMARLKFCLLVISGFLVGGVVGASAFRFYDYGALYFPALLTALVSIAYAAYRLKIHLIPEKI